MDDNRWQVITTAHPGPCSGELKISEFLSENFHFLLVKFSVYLNRLVFVM